MPTYNAGQLYEMKIQEILAERNLLPYDLRGNDAGFFHRGAAYYVEVKNKTAPDFGQKKLVWSKMKGWQWSEKDAVTDLYDELGVIKHIDRNFIPRKYTVSANNLSVLDKRYDRQTFEKRNIPLSNASYLYEFYARKHCYYIQIENKGLYFLKNDVANLLVPRFNPELTLRLRAKTHHSVPVHAYSFFAVIQARTSGMLISPFDLEEKVGVFPSFSE